MRMFVGSRSVLVRLLRMFVSSVGVLLRLFVLAKIMMVGGLMMMMRGSVDERRPTMCSLAGCFGDFAMALSSQPVLENGCRL